MSKTRNVRHKQWAKYDRKRFDWSQWNGTHARYIKAPPGQIRFMRSWLRRQYIRKMKRVIV